MAKLLVDQTLSNQEPTTAQLSKSTLSKPDENSLIRYKLVNDGVYLAVEICFSKNDGIKCASNTLISCSQNILYEEKEEGGVATRCCGCHCADPEFTLDYFDIKDEEVGERIGRILIAPKLQGEILFLDVDGEKSEWVVQSKAFFCADCSLNVEARGKTFSENAKYAMDDQEMYLMKITGKGNLLLNATGSIIKYSLNESEKRRIYMNYVLAWENKMSIQIFSGKKSSLGKGKEFEFIGPGTIYISTRPLPKSSEFQDAVATSCGCLQYILENFLPCFCS